MILLLIGLLIEPTTPVFMLPTHVLMCKTPLPTGLVELLLSTQPQKVMMERMMGFL